MDLKMNLTSIHIVLEWLLPVPDVTAVSTSFNKFYLQRSIIQSNNLTPKF